MCTVKLLQTSMSYTRPVGTCLHPSFSFCSGELRNQEDAVTRLVSTCPIEPGRYTLERGPRRPLDFSGKAVASLAGKPGKEKQFCASAHLTDNRCDPTYQSPALQVWKKHGLLLQEASASRHTGLEYHSCGLTFANHTPLGWK